MDRRGFKVQNLAPGEQPGDFLIKIFADKRSRDEGLFKGALGRAEKTAQEQSLDAARYNNVGYIHGMLEQLSRGVDAALDAKIQAAETAGTNPEPIDLQVILIKDTGITALNERNGSELGRYDDIQGALEDEYKRYAAAENKILTPSPDAKKQGKYRWAWEPTEQEKIAQKMGKLSREYSDMYTSPDMLEGSSNLRAFELKLNEKGYKLEITPKGPFVKLSAQPMTQDEKVQYEFVKRLGADGKLKSEVEVAKTSYTPEEFEQAKQEEFERGKQEQIKTQERDAEMDALRREIEDLRQKSERENETLKQKIEIAEAHKRGDHEMLDRLLPLLAGGAGGARGISIPQETIDAIAATVAAHLKDEARKANGGATG